MTSRELELKFQVPLAAQRALREELRRRGARSVRLIARYFDTPEDLLARHGLALRLRKEGRRWVQTLKASGPTLVDRLEHEVVLRVPAAGQPTLDLTRHDDSAVGALLRRTLAEAPDAAALIERYAVDITRLACRVALPDGEIEAAFDIGTIRAGERVAAIHELELEHKAGGVQGLFDLARLWRAHAALWLDTRSKSQRGAMLAQGLAHGTAAKARAPKLHDDMNGDQLLRAVMHAVIDQILANASELAAGCTEEEHVHQLRVGIRRLRTALRELGELSDPDASWEAVLSATFDRLGAVRDNETVAAAVKPLLEQAGAPKLAWPVPPVAVDLSALVREPAFQDMLLDVLRWSIAPPADADAVHSPAEARRLVERRLSRLHKQVARDGPGFEQLAASRQHQVRKRLKRLRYLAEFVSVLWPDKAVSRYLRRLAPAQDALGRHNDVAVARDKFRADAQDDPLSWFAAGYLHGHLALTAREAAAALEQVASAKRFWKG